MVSLNHSIAFVLCLLSLVWSVFNAQSKTLTSEQDIKTHIESLIEDSKQTIIDAYGTDFTNTSEPENKILEKEAIEIFVWNAADSLIFWTGRVIPQIDSDSWEYNVADTKIKHSFSYDAYQIIAKTSLDGNVIKLNSDSSSATHYEQIDYIKINKSKWPRLLSNGFFVLLIILLIRLVFAGSAAHISLILLSLGLIIFLNSSTSFLQIIEPSVRLLTVSFSVLALSIVHHRNPAVSKNHLILLLHTGLTGVFISGFVKIFELILRKESNLNFEVLDFTNPHQFVVALSSIVGLFAIWLFFSKAFNSEQEKATDKFLKFLVLASSCALTSLLFNVDLPLIFAILFLAIYFLSADLFFELEEPNITWMIWWVVLNSAFLASNLYFNSIKINISKNQYLLEKVYQNVNSEELLDIQKTQKLIAESQLIEKINDLPQGAKLLEDDIQSFLEESIGQGTEEFALFYFDSNGASSVLKKDLSRKVFESNIGHYKSINDTLSFDPFNKRFLFSFHKLPGFHLLSSPIGKKDDFIKYGVFELNKHVYGDISQIPIEIPKIDKDTIITVNAESHIFYRPEPKLLLYSKKTYANLLKPISLFSYLFCLSFFLLFIIIFFNSKFKILPDLPLQFRQIKSLRLKIQLAILLMILLSFVTIAWITAYYFNTILHSNKEGEITNKLVALNNALQQRLDKIYDLQSAQNIIENELPKLASINSTEAEFFELSGYKLNENDHLYPYYLFHSFKFQNMNKPFTRIKDTGSVQAYFPVINQQLGLIGFMTIQNSNQSFNKKNSLSDFLGSILNLYVFLFLMAGAITIAVSRSITKPLAQLGNRINSLKVGGKNEEIQWASEDEIGDLIGSYNEMVKKLELNIGLLAKTERDMAWREMAKQVAHEIKNPLTPMKLSIQYLKQAIQRNPDKTEALVDKTSNTLIEQIENLVGIADAFSNMASLPQANNEKIILNEVVAAVHDLFRKREDIAIQLQEPLEEIEVYADKGHLVRILNNLVKNAIQSIPEEKMGEIIISLYTDKANAIIRVKDNGSGIPLELRDKIFTPKFTTKSSGSGLGLAISANMIESMNGRIYFDSEDKEGTSFFIEIPLIRTNIQANTDKSRIVLE